MRSFSVSPIDHFAFGPVTPILAFAMSVAGSSLGLNCATRARASTGRARGFWLALAAFAIGGIGIWVMHFIAMLGFQVEGVDIRFDVPLTLLSVVVAVVVVGAALFIVGFGNGSTRTLLGAGILAGLGVASMHYLGMYGMHMDGDVHYDAVLVAASVVIAVVAGTVALWFTTRLRGQWVITAAALVMGLVISAMHYTGMAAMQVSEDPGMPLPTGVSGFDLLLPVIMGVSLLAVIMFVTIGLSLTEEERELERQFEQQLADRAAGIRTYTAATLVRAEDPAEMSWR